MADLLFYFFFSFFLHKVINLLCFRGIITYATLHSDPQLRNKLDYTKKYYSLSRLQPPEASRLQSESLFTFLYASKPFNLLLLG